MSRGHTLRTLRGLVEDHVLKSYFAKMPEDFEVETSSCPPFLVPMNMGNRSLRTFRTTEYGMQRPRVMIIEDEDLQYEIYEEYFEELTMNVLAAAEAWPLPPVMCPN